MFLLPPSRVSRGQFGRRPRQVGPNSVADVVGDCEGGQEGIRRKHSKLGQQIIEDLKLVVGKNVKREIGLPVRYAVPDFADADSDSVKTRSNPQRSARK